jgi:hypothetical protein
MGDPAKIGQNATYQDPRDEYDAEHGTYDDPTMKVAIEEKVAMRQNPRGPEKSPFSMGTLTPAKGG